MLHCSYSTGSKCSRAELFFSLSSQIASLLIGANDGQLKKYLGRMTEEPLMAVRACEEVIRPNYVP